MNSLVLIVEDEHSVASTLRKFLKIHNINFIVATNLADAIDLFENNKGTITHIALDGNLTNGDHHNHHPDTIVLAKIIADSVEFEGLAFPMSSYSDHNEVLINTLGKKGVMFNDEKNHIKVAVINEIIRRIRRGRMK